MNEAELAQVGQLLNAIESILKDVRNDSLRLTKLEIDALIETVKKAKLELRSG